MVSDLWVASEHGDLAKLLELLEAGNVDIEIKDHEGVTPLIAAVKNGHRDLVVALLDKGADPANASLHGLPESYTSDPAIVDLLRTAAASKAADSHPGAEANGYVPESHQPPRGYYMPPPSHFYFPGMPPPPEGAVPFFPPPPPPQLNGEHAPHPPAASGGGHPNLPPPEIARLIPCRYFPACRYGASCMFAHPPGPYAPPPPPPSAQYPAPYEGGASPPYPPNFYSMPPPPPHSFPSPNGLPPQHMPPMSPQSAAQGIPPPPPQPLMHSRSASEMLSPAQGAFSPGMPAPMPYGPTSPISPATYPNGVSSQPHTLPIPPPMALGGPQSPQVYPQTAVSPPGHVYEPPMDLTQPPSLPQSAPAQQTSYPPPAQHDISKTSPPIANGDVLPMNGPRDPIAHNRRGSFRRGPSFGNRKPPCAFFPSGRCRNGDECRFPHIMSDHPPAHQGPPPFMGRGGRFRGPPAHLVNGNGHANGTNGLEEGLKNLGLRDDQLQSPRGRGSDRGTNSSSSSHARGAPGKNGLPATNGGRPSPKPFAPKQRVPNADEFPVLGGTTTPPRGTPTNGLANGLTAAQVLQAAAPTRKELVKDLFRGAPVQPQATVTDGPILTSATPTPVPVAPTPIVSKLPVSFAAAATGLPDASKEVSVAA